MKVGDIVCPATESDARAIESTYRDFVSLVSRFEILAIIIAGEDYHGLIKKPGYILRALDNKPGVNYPYIWDADRFVVAREMPDGDEELGPGTGLPEVNS